MQDAIKVSNGKSWLAKGLLQTVLILAMAIFIIVDKVIPPPTNSVVQAAILIEKRLATLEECIQSLRPLPYDMAAVKTSIQGIEKQIDKIEKKLDSEK